MFIRVAKNPHHSQQRLGFLKYLTYTASQSDSTTLKTLETYLLQIINVKEKIELDDSLRTYIKRRLRNKFINKLENQQKKIYLDLQDIYLADPQMPSKTGKLYVVDCIRYPYFISSIGFVREKTYSLLVRGKVFLEFVPKEELNAFTNYTKTLNPFLLNDYQKYICLYSIIENDGYVLKPLYNKLLSLKKSFSDWSAGDFLAEIYMDIVKLYRPNVTSGVDIKKLDGLSYSAKRIERWANKPRTGGRGAKIDAITPRLEPFVDLGLLKKQDPYKYTLYYFSKHGRKFFNLFCFNKDVDKFLNDSFFSAINKSFKLMANSAKEEEIINAIFSAFNIIKSPLGYAPIKEVALFGAIKLLIDNKKIFEVGQATDLIMKYQKSHPYKARFQADRSGAPVYVKFINNVKNK